MGTRKERILQKINPNLLKVTPKLSGDMGSLIDLDSEDSLEDGAKILKMRFFRNQDLCEKNKRNSAQKETELTISTARYNEKDELCEIVSQKVILPFGNDDVSGTRGKKLQDLKMELQEKISAKWLKEYNKRVSENKGLNESKGSCKKERSKKHEDPEEDEEIEEEYDEANDADVEDDEDEEVDKEIEEDEKEEENDATSTGNDEEVPEDGCEDKTEDNQDKVNECDDEEGCSWVPAYQPGGGMLYGGSELTQSDDGLPQSLLSPSLKLSLSDPYHHKASQGNSDQTPKKSDKGPTEEMITSFTEKVKLFSQNKNDSYDLNDAFEFCSGKFPDADEEAKVNSEDDEVDSEEDEDGCDDKFGSAIEEESDKDCQTEEVESKKKAPRKNIITYEDSEEEKDVEEGPNVDEDEGPQSVHPKLLSDDEENSKTEDKTESRKKKIRKNLQFSDEEDATEDCEEQESEAENDDEDEADVGEECEKRSIHYDSEENEIINPREFFEKEAELSGSEWSGDEDERGLDELDAEEGDADNLDEDQVRSQLERIHVRRVLDDDAREVRLLQEILFEDGDLYTDGKVRERKFKWKNLGNFDDEEKDERPKEDDGSSSEDDGAEEEQMRKMRHEKEVFLMEKSAKKNDQDLSSDEEIVENFHTVKVTSVKTSIRQTGNGERNENIKTLTDYFAKTTVRGSFLTRNEELLSRLAKATSGIIDNVLGPKNSKNFVFVTRSPEKVDPKKSTACKRQVEESCSRREKKVKLQPQEIDTGPSILDFLV